MSTRKFYRRTFEIEVLSEEPIPEGLDMDELRYQITEGAWSGMMTARPEEEVDGRQMAELLTKQHSDPGFFGLTEEGDDACFGLTEEGDDA